MRFEHTLALERFTIVCGYLLGTAVSAVSADAASPACIPALKSRRPLNLHISCAPLEPAFFSRISGIQAFIFDRQVPASIPLIHSLYDSVRLGQSG
jgi:hypothetical protein